MSKISSSLIGASGVHFIVSELCLRGLIALPTIRNTAGVDIVVSNMSGTWHANLQVKTSKDKVGFWPISEKYHTWNGPNNYYVFARFLKENSRFEVFLEPSDRVIEQVDATVEDEKRRGLRLWSPCWYLRDGADRVRNQWIVFGTGNT